MHPENLKKKSLGVFGAWPKIDFLTQWAARGGIGAGWAVRFPLAYDLGCLWRPKLKMEPLKRRLGPPPLNYILIGKF